jgi:hypothetical protein
MPAPLRLSSAAEALTMMQEAFGAYRAVISDSPEEVRVAAWADVREVLKTFQDSEFIGPAEVLVAAGTRAV